MNISDFFLRAKNLRTANRIQNEEFQLNVEQLEPRMMLNGNVGNVVFQANFEDVNVAPNGFAFFSQVSGMTATGLPVEIQRNHPSVGPASEGQQHLELDGVNGVAVDIVAGSVDKLLLQVDYSARPGVSTNQNAIEVYWNDQLIQTLSEDGRRLRKTNFHQFEIELPGASGRLEFRSNSPDDEFGLGGLIDNVKVLEKLGPIQLAEIADQDVFLGSELNVNASLLAPNQNLAGAVYSITNAPAGMQIDPVTGAITWIASQENINNSDNEDDQVIIGDPVLKFQSGFEDANVDAGGFAFFSTVSGFTATPGVVEIQNNHPSVGGPSEGSNHLELDGVNAIHRDVATKVGDKYELVFDYSPRPSVSAADNAIEVWWNGELLETVTAEGKNLRRTRFNEYRFDLSEFTGDLTRLEFRSNSDDIAVGLGGLLDNVRLYHRTVEVITGTTGKYNITVSVSDGNGRSDTETFAVCVQEGAPVAPVLSEIADQTITEKESLDLALTATDADSTAAQLKFELVSGPTGATVDEATGKVAWSPTEADGPGQFEFEVKVTDQSGLSDTKSFQVAVTEVNEAPVISSVSNQTVVEGQSLSVDFDATDSDLPTNSLKFTIVSGPDGAVINETTGEFTFAPSEAQAGSTFAVEVRVDDGVGGSDTTTFDVVVDALPDRPPVLTAVSDQTVNEGEQLEVFLMATDPDSPTDQLTFELISGPAGLAVAAATGQLIWTPTEAQGPGDYDVVVKVTDETSLSDSKTFKVTVAEVNVAPVLTAIEDQVLADGESINLTASATDTDVPANTLTYSIDAGPVGATIDAATGAFSWTPTAAQTPGVYDVTVSVSDGAGGSDTESFQIRVNVVNESPVLTAIEDQTINENTTLSVQAVAADGDLPAQTITYSLSVAPTGATIDGSTGLISWTTGEAEGPGTYDFTVVATDSENATDQESFQVTVNEVNAAPVLASISDQTVVQNQLLELTATATDADLPANPLTFGLSGTVPNGLTINVTTGTVSWTPTNTTMIGDYDVIVTVSDGNGGSDMTTVKITVTPELAGILLTEGEDFETTHEETIEITADTKELVFEFAESFDKTDVDFVNDAFEVALLDVAGNSLVHTIDSSRDSFFNFTEDEFVATGVNTIVDGSTVKLDLSLIAEGTTAKLVFRLVNNDTDTETQVRITDLETTANLLNTSVGASFSAATAQPEQTIDFVALTDVTGSVRVDYGQTSFDADSGNLYTDVRLTNNANHPIDGPFVLVVHSITDPTVVVSGSSGVTPDGNRYYLMNDSTGTSTIESGASTLAKTLEFFNPNEVQFGYQISVLAQPNIAPEFVTSPNNEGEAGVAYTYDAEATDADNDFLVYELMAGPEGLTVDSETGLINWMPETEDLGRHSVIVEVADGRGGKDMQQYDIEVVEDRPNRPPVIVSSPVVEAFVKPVSEGDGTNLVVNGNFEDGNVGFETDLTHTPNSLLGASTYAIVTDPHPLNSFATSYGDHTTGEGNMMGINGATSPNTVWRQTVSVSQDVTYYFAGFVSSMFPEAISRLSLWVNDEQVDDLAVPNETGQWELVVASWDSENATTAKLEIRNSVTAFRGNDFALDDIYFGTEPREIANYVYQTEAIDPDLDPIAYQLDSAPAGMAIDADSGLITWNPTGDQVGVHTVAVTANDGRGGTATQEYQVRVLADPTNTAPVIVSDPVDDFFIPGFSNPASGEVTPQRIALDLGNGETFEGTVSIQLPGTAARFADIVLAVDESASMSGDQAWVGEMIPLLDAALVNAGIGTVEGSPNRFAILGFGGGRDQISVGHFINSQAKTKYTLYGPNNVVVAEGLFNDVVPDELLNLDLPSDGRYVLVVEAQDNANLATGIDIGVEGQTGETVRIEELTLNTIVEDVIGVPGQKVQYNFSLSVDTLIYFDSLAKDARLQWTLTGPTGTVVENTNFNLPITSVLLAYDLVAGDYQLTIDSNFDIPADYKFQVLDLATATTISSGEIVSGEFELKAETFAYQFSADAGEIFELVNSTTGVHSQSRWRLLNEAGEEVLVDYLGVNQPGFTLETTGVYYLLMESNLSPKEGSFQLRAPSLFEFAATVSAPTPPIEVVLGDVIRGEIEYTNQFVDYSFSLAQRSLVYLDSLVDSSLSWTLDGPRQTEVNNRRFDLTDSFNNANPVLDLVAGDYTLRINSNGQAGVFAFKVVDLTSATEITPGAAFDGELTIANETDLYRFNAGEGNEFYFDVEAASDNANTQFKLIDPFGQVVFISNRLRDQVTTTIPSSGTYTLLVEGWRANEDADTYTINVVPVAERAVAMTLGSQVNETIATPGERVAFTFDLADDALLYFDSLTNDSNIVWSLSGPAGDEIELRQFTRSDSTDVVAAAIPARAGSYKLVVQRTTDSVGDFSFILENLLTDGATSPITPNPGLANTTVNVAGTIATNETQLYRFNAQPGDQFSFDGSATGSTNAFYRVIDSIGNEIVADTRVISDRSDVIFVEGGEYYLLVEGRINNDTASEYSLDINWIQNNGETLLAGNPLTLNTTVDGDLAVDGQVDQFTFTLTERTLLYMDSLTNSGSVRWNLHGPTGTTISNRAFSATDSFNNSNPVGEFIAGEYQLEVYASSGTPGVYAFRMVDLESAIAITPGTAFDGQLDPANETNLYNFAAVAGDQFYFDVETASDTTNTQYKLIDPFGNVVFISNRMNDSDVQTVDFEGTYTLLVEGWRGNTDLDTYTMNIHKLTPASSGLTLGTPVTGSIDAPGEVAAYTFSLADRQQIVFDSNTNNSNFSWTLEGPQGIVVNGRRFDLSDSSSQNNTVLDLPLGDYQLTIDGTGSETGPFGFALLNLADATAINIGDVVQETLAISNSSKAFRFDAQDGDIVYFDGLGNDANFSQTPTWRLVNQYGVQVFNQGLTSDFGPVTLTAGTYTLLVEGRIGDTGANGEFNFELIALGNEINPVAPTPLVIGEIVSSETSTVYETDRYSFSLSELAQIHFDSLTHDSTLVWTLEHNGRTLVNSRRFDISDARSTIASTLALDAGDYVLSVFSTQAEPYSFRLVDLSSAPTIAVGDLVSGSFETPNGTDTYRFSATEGESIYVDVLSSSKSGGAIYRILDEFGNDVLFSTSIRDQDSFVIPRNGDYWLLVEAGVRETVEQSYELRLHSTTTTTVELTIGDLASGNLAAPGDTFEYQFEFTENTFIAFDSLTNRNDMGWSLASETSVIASRNFGSSDSQGFNPTLDLAAGIYTLTVDGALDAIGDFAFRLLDLSKMTVINFGTTVSGDYAISNETDAYQFAGIAGQKLLFDVESSASPAGTQVRIIDRLGNEILNSSGLVDREVIELELTGTYYVLIEGRINNTASNPYEFSLQETLIRDEGAISLNTAIAGAIAGPGEQVTYSFDVVNDSLIHFDSLANNPLLTWSLEGPRGLEFLSKRFSQSDSTAVSNTTDPTPAFELRAGSYTLTVDGLNGVVGDFGFNLINLSDGTQSTLVTPTTGTPVAVSGTQVNPRETQVFRFEAVAGDQFSFDSTTGENSSHYRLLDSFGKQIFIQRSDIDRATVSLPITGTYFLLVEGLLSNTSADTFSINVLKEGNTPVADFAGDALALGSTQTGDLATSGQVDSFTFTLSQRSLVYMDMLSPNLSSVRWNLTGPRGVEISNQALILTNSFNNNDPVLDLVAGDYHLEILASSGTPGAYDFTLYDLIDATSVVVGTPFSGELALATETDFYKFEATTGQQFFFDVETTSDATNTQYKLVDRYGQVVFISSRFSDQEVATIPRDGTYTLLIEGANFNTGVDSYTMNIVPFVETPKTLLTTGVNNASIDTVGEKVVYEFNLAEDRLLYVDPLGASREVTWSLRGELYDYVLEKRFDQGIEFIELVAGDYTITVDGVGDYLGDASLVVFATSQADQLATDGSITSGNLDSANGVQVFQFNGTAGEHFALLPDFNLQFTDSATAALTADKYTASGDPEDGYSGLDAAIRADVFREGAAINYILVTDEDRDVAEDNVTFESLFRTITAQSALLNMVTTAQFRDDTNTRAIGVDSEGTAYIADGAGGFTVGTGGFTTTTNVSFVQDYIDLAWALDGANWDLGLLRGGGVNAESFTNAFIDVKVDEILEQTALRLIPSDLDADFEVTDPTGGLYTEVVGGETYDFDIRLGNDGQPVSYDLLFKQGQTVGSIPVFIISPYQYGASAVDADGDTLTWSLVSGPEGMVIDPSTGELAWTAEDIVYGEHEITIRVDDGRGGFDEQTFVLNVNGGEAASISGRVADLETSEPKTVQVVVSGQSNPYLAGLPVGSPASGGDTVPDQSPALTEGFLSEYIPGTVVTFSATGGVSYAGEPADSATPDGDPSPTGSHNAGPSNGISNFVAPWNALMGVFLSDASPITNPAPGTLDYSENGNVVDGIDYLAIAPELQQLFFIGDGVNSDGVRQEVTIPEGATRLYLGTTDGYGWFNNGGFFSVEVTAQQYVPPEDVIFEVFLDENRNGLLDENERSETTDENGDFTFSSVAAGSYVVAQRPLEGWSQRIPADGTYEVSLDPGESLDGIFFGNEQIALVNTDPVITSQPVTSAIAGEAFEYSPTIEELDGDTLVFDTPLSPAGLAVNPDNGTIRWTPRMDQTGTQNILLRVRDGNGGFDLQYFQVEVAEPNSAPVITSTPPTGPAGVGLPYVYDVNSVDAQEDAVTYSLSASPEGMTIDSATGLIQWTPAENQIGVATITIVALDERGLSSEQTFDLTVELSPENVAPVFLSEAPLEVRLGDNYLYKVATFDQNGDPTTLTLDAGPDGMTLDPNGLIVWQPGPDQLGEQTVRLVVTDGRGGSATQEFALEVTTQPVNFPPEITSAPLTAAIAGEGYVFQPTAEDRNNDTLFWSLENAPMGMTIDPVSGQINWEPGTEEIGAHDVTVQVMDTYAAFSQLIYTLRVRAVNSPPVILTAPNTSGAVGSTYLYQVGAEDVDQDRLTFSMISGPTGLSIDTDTGLVQWTPGAGQDGTADVEIAVSDSLGASVSQVYSIVVADGQPNQLPVISSTPGFFATVDGTYTYQIAAEDPDGDVITYTLLSSQAGMTVNATTGLLEWTPTAADLGTTLVEIVARDPALGGSIQQFSLTVWDANNAPVINSTPPTSLSPGQPLRYDILASDADGDFLTYELVSGPEGFLIDGLGRTFWIPQADQLGDNTIEVKVTDTRGAFATQSFTVNVAADTTAPQVVVNLSDNPVDVGSMVDIRVQAVDNVGVKTLVLTVDGVAVPLDANGNARIELNTVGSLTALATATDAAGNSSTDSVEIFVADPNDVDGPVVSITTPGDGDSITAPTDIIGTVFDDTLVSYRLLLAEFGSRDFKEIGSGTENVDNDVLGQIDPTLLENGSYILRLEAFDAGGNGNVVEQAVEIAGGAKIGDYRLTFKDVSVNLAGIPIQIFRTYDSFRSTDSGDFGFGWSLSIWDTNLSIDLPQSGLENMGIYSPFEIGTRVYITLPNGARQGFTFDPILRTLPGFGNDLTLASPRFRADPGVTSTLSAGGGQLFINEFGQLSASGGIPWNPASADFGGGFTLTVDDGTKYRIDGNSGQVTSVTDRNNNRLSLTGNGITSNVSDGVQFERDAQGRITRIIDPLGNDTSYNYDANGDLVSFNDLNGNETTFAYLEERAHYLETVTDPLGRVGSRVEYDDQGRLVRVFGTGGTSVSIAHDINNQVETVRDVLGNETVYFYDDRGNTTEIVDALGGVTRFTYDTNGNLLSTTDALGRTSTATYDSRGNVLTQTNPMGETISITYNSFGQVTSTSDPLGNSTTQAYDAQGNLIESVNQIGATITTTYDANGKPISSTDAMGNTATIVYDGNSLDRVVDPSGNVLDLETNALGNITDQSLTIQTSDGPVVQTFGYRFDGTGTLTGVSNPRGVDSELELDAAGRVTGVSGSGTEQNVTFDEAGFPTEFEDGEQTIAVENNLLGAPVKIEFENGTSVTYEYDVLGRRTKASFSSGREIFTNYDAVGQTVNSGIGDGDGSVRTYDDAGRVTSVVLENGDSVQFEYDAAGRTTSTTDTLGNKTSFTYDDAGRLIKTTYPDGTSQQNTYDLNSNLIEVVLRDGSQWAYTYGKLGSLTSVTDPLGNETIIGNDSVGNLDSITDNLGRTTQVVYNELGRRVKKILPLGQTETITYTNDGLVDTLVDLNGFEKVFVYDSQGRIVRVNDKDGNAIQETRFGDGTIEYEDRDGVSIVSADGQGNISSIVSDRGTQNYAYADGRVFQITNNGRSTEYIWSDLGAVESYTGIDGDEVQTIFDANGRAIESRFSDGSRLERSFTFDGLIETVAFFDSDDNAIQQFTYQRFADSQISSITELNGAVTSFVYDALDRLVLETQTKPGAPTRTIEYGYDATGNLISHIDGGIERTLVYDANDRLLSDGDYTYTWDNRGSLLSRSDGNITETFTYDALNQLIRVERSGTTPQSIEYAYEFDGLLAERTVDGSSESYIWNRGVGSQPTLLEVHDSNGDMIVRYDHDGIRYTQAHFADGSTVQLSTDQLGTIRGIISDSALTEIQQNSAYGGIASSSLPGLSFVGGIADPITGLIYFQSRWYDPSNARFTQADGAGAQLADSRTMNRYVYTLADPVNRRDPSGQTPSSVTETTVTTSIQATLAKIGAIVGSASLVFSNPNFFSAGVVDKKPESGVTYPFINYSGSFKKGSGGENTGGGPLRAGYSFGFGFDVGFELVELNQSKSKDFDLYLYAGATLGAGAVGSVAFGNGPDGKGKFRLRTAKGTVYDTQTVDEYTGFFFSVTAGAGANIPAGTFLKIFGFDGPLSVGAIYTIAWAPQYGNSPAERAAGSHSITPFRLGTVLADDTLTFAQAQIKFGFGISLYLRLHLNELFAEFQRFGSSLGNRGNPL